MPLKLIVALGLIAAATGTTVQVNAAGETMRRMRDREMLANEDRGVKNQEWMDEPPPDDDESEETGLAPEPAEQRGSPTGLEPEPTQWQERPTELEPEPEPIKWGRPIGLEPEPTPEPTMWRPTGLEPEPEPEPIQRPERPAGPAPRPYPNAAGPDAKPRPGPNTTGPDAKPPQPGPNATGPDANPSALCRILCSKKYLAKNTACGKADDCYQKLKNKKYSMVKKKALSMKCYGLKFICRKATRMYEEACPCGTPKEKEHRLLEEKEHRHREEKEHRHQQQQHEEST